MKKFNKIILASLVLLLVLSLSAVYAAPKNCDNEDCDKMTMGKSKHKMQNSMKERKFNKERKLDPKVVEIQNKIVDLRKEGRDLKNKYDEASEQDKSAIKSQMKDKIAATYDLRVQLMEYNISKMQTKVQEFKSNKDKNVDELLNKIVSAEPKKDKKFKKAKNKKGGFRGDNRSGKRGGRWMDDDDDMFDE